ncbi:MAG: DUF4325 domain-containing protein [Prevotella sp.]|nr:DUF4325 domain-containing protein [Prevotella sp.]
MKQTIRLQDIYSADLYTRSRASELRACISEEADEVTLDFEGIGFMSRSFADEVCNIIDDMKDKTFSFINQNDDVAAMMTKVREGRSRERKRGVGNARMYEFEDMEKLSEFLIAM